ncbi:MAG TPA: hypothetical protein VNA69_07380 [Thermoanaerobaculia bacterium]|nr:hypothetical protein [Thermoanaerobaculia bacterium]
MTVPAQVRQLIERHIRSATEIELLLLLHRSPETFWTPSAAATVVGASELDVRAHFGRFEGAGLIERGRQTDAFRFAPASEENRDAVAALAEAYTDNRRDVLRIVIGSLSQITAFSDAFRLPRG